MIHCCFVAAAPEHFWADFRAVWILRRIKSSQVLKDPRLFMFIMLSGAQMKILEDPKSFSLSLIIVFVLSVCLSLVIKRAAERMGILPCENVFQISFGTLWQGFRLYCWDKLCQNVNASMASYTQIPSFFFFSPAVLHFEPQRWAYPNNKINNTEW